MEMAQDQREILLGKPTPVVDHRASGQGLDPSGEAIARPTEFGVGRIIEGSHAFA